MSDWEETVRKARALRHTGPPAKPIPPNNCVPDCPVCGGVGYVSYDVPVGHPEFGRMYPCPNKPANNEPGKLGLARGYEQLSWDDILPDGNVMEAVKVVREVLEVGYGWVYLFGAPGRGKTMILERAVKDAAERGYWSRYTQTHEILSILRGSFDEERKQFSLDTRMDMLTRMRLLAIDELDRFNKTGWADEQINRLMDERYRSALHQETITIMASNASYMVYDPYLKDRILDGRFHVVNIIGDSLRPAAEYPG